jgi:hypothetical protein
MRSCSYLFLSLWSVAVLVAAVVPLSAQTATDSRVALANLTQDVKLLTERVGELQLEVETLRRENRQLEKRNETLEKAMGGVNQIIESEIAALRTQLLEADKRQKKEIVAQVSRQMERLATQMQRAVEAVASAQAASAPPPEEVSFSDDFPRENGIVYEVKPGDTLWEIAKKFDSSVRDIRNANRIVNERGLQVGQTLFVPRRTSD